MKLVVLKASNKTDVEHLLVGDETSRLNWVGGDHDMPAYQQSPANTDATTGRDHVTTALPVWNDTLQKKPYYALIERSQDVHVIPGVVDGEGNPLLITDSNVYLESRPTSCTRRKPRMRSWRTGSR